MRWLLKVALSSIGAKVLMALTGIILVGFLFGHMIGNLQIFAGQQTLNDYAEFLHSKPLFLWAFRSVMIVSLLVHFVMSARLTLMNQAARPVGYAALRPLKSTLTSRNMFITGFLILAFLTYHLLHLTLHKTNPGYASLLDAQGRPDVYGMVVLGFQNELISGTYMVAMVLLGLHLSHAVSSLFQSLGLNSPKYFGLTDKLGPAIGIILIIGNLSMPIAVLAGYVEPAAGGMQP